MKIRIGICDDSDHDRHYLKSIIKNYFKGREIEPEIVEYGSGEEFFRKPDVEILFLDIEMNALDGIMVKNELQKLQAETRIVFTTSHNDLMRDAFGKQVFGFLVKRVSPKEVEKYLNAILKDLEEENCVLIKGAEKETFVKEKQILYIKAETKYCDIILENQDSMFSAGLVVTVYRISQKYAVQNFNALYITGPDTEHRGIRGKRILSLPQELSCKSLSSKENRG